MYAGFYTTAAVDTNTTQIATTAYVINQAYAKVASPTFTGTPSLLTFTTGITQRGLGRNQNKKRSMTHFWHYMFAPTNKKPDEGT